MNILQTRLSTTLTQAETRIPSSFLKFFSYFGLFYTAYKAIQLLSPLRRLFWFQKDLLTRYGKDSYALITGGANGLGRGFALELARLGFNIIILDMDTSSIEKLRTDIAQACPNAKFIGITIDFTKILNGEAFFEEINVAIRDFDISILVNNVGMALAGPFESFGFQQLKNVTLVNVLPQVLITHKVVNKMLKRPLNVKSGIINMSGFTALKPTKYFQVNASTKLFNHALSKALYDEYSERIDVLSVLPVWVKTALSSNFEGFGSVGVEETVKGALGSLGNTSET